MSLSRIHPTAIVHNKAQLDSTVEVGPYAIIEDDVTIAAGCKIGPRALIASGTRLDENVIVHHCATVGTIPQDLKFEGEKTVLRVGAGTIIREYATLNRGTKWSGESVVGKNCLLMAYCHIPHDAHVGDHVIMANSVQMGGHVVLGDYAIIGGGCVIHQFVKIGAHVMIGGGLRVVKDIIPFALAGGFPLKIEGINLIGLKRRGFAPKQIDSIKAAYKLLFWSGLNTTQAVEKIGVELEQTEEIRLILDFISASERGILKAEPISYPHASARE